MPNSGMMDAPHNMNRMGGGFNQYNSNTNIYSNQPYHQQQQYRENERPPRMAPTNQIQCPENVIVLHHSKTAQFYVYLTKEYFHKQKFEQIELHAVGDPCIPALASTTNMLTKFGYCEIVKLRTKQVIWGNKLQRLPKLIVVVKRAENFEKVYADF